MKLLHYWRSFNSYSLLGLPFSHNLTIACSRETEYIIPKTIKTAVFYFISLIIIGMHEYEWSTRSFISILNHCSSCLRWLIQKKYLSWRISVANQLQVKHEKTDSLQITDTWIYAQHYIFLIAQYLIHSDFFIK